MKGTYDYSQTPMIWCDECRRYTMNLIDHRCEETARNGKR